jgi:hypothetical protein
MKQQTIPYNQTVFIGYADAAMTVECKRLYPTDAASYFLAMDEIIQTYGSNWAEYDRRLVDLTPYQRWQLEKKGDILPVDAAFASHTEDAENTYWAVDKMGRLAEEHYAALLDDHWGY